MHEHINTKTTATTTFAQRATPPSKSPLLLLIPILLVGIFVAAAGYSSLLVLMMITREGMNATFMVALTVALAASAGALVVLFIYWKSAFRSRLRSQSSEARAQWQRSWICRSCGHVFLPG